LTRYHELGSSWRAACPATITSASPA